MAFYQPSSFLAVSSFMKFWFPQPCEEAFAGSPLHSQLSDWCIFLPVTVPHAFGPQGSAALPALRLGTPGRVSQGFPVCDCSPARAELPLHTSRRGKLFPLGAPELLEHVHPLTPRASPTVHRPVFPLSHLPRPVGYRALPSWLASAFIPPCFQSRPAPPSLDSSRFHPPGLFTSSHPFWGGTFIISLSHSERLVTCSLLLDWRAVHTRPPAPGPWTRPAWPSLGLGSHWPSPTSCLSLQPHPSLRGLLKPHLLSSRTPQTAPS